MLSDLELSEIEVELTNPKADLSNIRLLVQCHKLLRHIRDVSVSRLAMPPSMTRPPLQSVAPPGSVVICPCGQCLNYAEAIADHWTKGHFDTPANPAVAVDVADLVEKLGIANLKLYEVCNKKAELGRQPTPQSQLETEVFAQASAENMRQDVELCKLRASLKNQINAAFGFVQDVKLYGKGVDK